MCRMLASFGTIDYANGALREFRRLAEEGRAPAGEHPGHKDGWGIVCYANGALKVLERRTGNAAEDDLYLTASREAERLRPRILLAHLRKASCGMEISLQNTQPLQRGSWSFTHNGTIWSPLFRGANGESDSVIFFENLLDKVQRKSESETTTQRLLDEIRRLRKLVLNNPNSEGRTYSSITFILSDGNSLWVLRDFNNNRDEDYYTMHYLHSTDFTLFCQEKIIPGSWHSIENKYMVIVNGGNKLETVECL